jgi:DHA1 family bicyclomycin/chloramphenicol resistance-like MFS transporter
VKLYVDCKQDLVRSCNQITLLFVSDVDRQGSDMSLSHGHTVPNTLIYILVLKMKKIFCGRKLPLVELSVILLGIVLWPEMELLVPSLPNMMEYFLVSEGQIQQVLSVNFLGFIFGVILAGPLCDSLGRRKITILGMLLFLLASLWASMASSLGMIMTARFFQGFFVTGPIIGPSTMLLEKTSGQARVFWMSMSSASITFAMASAPLVGAIINEFYGFRGNLWAIFVLGFLGFLPFVFLAKETLPKEKAVKLDPKFFVKNYLSILKKREFMRLAIAVSTLPAAFWIYSGVSSLYLINYLGLKENLFGLYQAPITGIFAILSLSISFIAKKLGKKLSLKIGFLLMLVSSISLLLMSILGQESIFGTTILMMLYVGGMVPANSLLFPEALSKLTIELQGSGQAMIQILRLLFSLLGTASLGLFYTGPFMPIAIILALLFLVSSFLIYQERENLIEHDNSVPMIGL